MSKQKGKIKFIDFCAGIGAGRLGLEKNGMECVGFSEIDGNAEKTYRKFFGNEEENYGDLMKVDTKKMPGFDMMIAGFPCQTFSIVGQRKGMSDDRGQIIYGLIRIMQEKNLKYFILENVKGLVNHDQGRTISIIRKELDKAGYKIVFNEVLNSENYGVPQMRERIYFVGVRKDLAKQKDFDVVDLRKSQKLQDCLVEDDSWFEFKKSDTAYATFEKYLNNRYNKGKHNLKDFLRDDYLVLDTRQSDLRIYKNKVPTLRTGRHGILYVRNGRLRKLSGYESLLLQGFPKRVAKKAKGELNNNHLLSQAGNAMTVNVIERLGQNLLRII